MSEFMPTISKEEDRFEEDKYHRKLAEYKDTRFNNTDLVYPWTFRVVPGFFEESKKKEGNEFGLVKSWESIKSDLLELNQQANSNEMYKLLYCAREFESFPDVIIEKYGVEKWKNELYRLESYCDIKYAPDPDLTEGGKKQAQGWNEIWKQEIKDGAPIPEKFYSSPLQRSCQTLIRTWEGIIPKDNSHGPIIELSLRETIGLSKCDKRPSKSELKEKYSKLGFVIDEEISERDDLHSSVYREKLHEQGIRVNSFLQKLYEEDWDGSKAVDIQKAKDHTYIYTASHPSSIRCMLMVLGEHNYSNFPLIPLVVKGSRRL